MWKCVFHKKKLPVVVEVFQDLYFCCSCCSNWPAFRHFQVKPEQLADHPDWLVNNWRPKQAGRASVCSTVQCSVKPFLLFALETNSLASKLEWIYGTLIATIARQDCSRITVVHCWQGDATLSESTFPSRSQSQFRQKKQHRSDYVGRAVSRRHSQGAIRKRSDLYISPQCG